MSTFRKIDFSGRLKLRIDEELKVLKTGRATGKGENLVMNESLASRLAILIFVFQSVFSHATERLVLVGGGDLPKAAVAKISDWAGGKKATILVISWGTETPEESFAYFKENILPFQPASIEAAPVKTETAQEQDLFLSQLGRATGVYFSGGDQNRIMAHIKKDRLILNALNKRFREGIVFAGTSAGTAIMSNTMLTGNADLTVIDPTKSEVSEGLGVLKNAVLDQHFLKRQRVNRLFSVLMKSPETIGIGIDEGTALAIEDSRMAQVVGPGMVMVVDASERPGKFGVHLLQMGESFDLVTQKKMD